MRGGAQSQLMYCSDGGLYVVKFTNNPQHLRVLANEMLASLLARHLGLPVAEGVIVEVDSSLVRSSQEMTIQLQSTKTTGFLAGCLTPPIHRVFAQADGVTEIGVRGGDIDLGAFPFASTAMEKYIHML